MNSWISKYKKIFSNKIKENFLAKVLYRVEELSNELNLKELFDFKFNIFEMIEYLDLFYYEICENIIGIHSSNNIFLNDDERKNNEQNEEYIKNLALKSIEQLKLRKYSSSFFSEKQIISGDDFLFFPVPYKLFSIVTNVTKALENVGYDYEFRKLYFNIFNKAIAVLVLLGDNLLDSCYPIARGIIELYLKLLILKFNPLLIHEHNSFVELEIKINCSGKNYDENFNEKWKNRTNKHCNKKIEYLHYGWLDGIQDYHKNCGNKAYSPSGLFNYLQYKYDIANNKYKEVLIYLNDLYKISHSYTHGNIGNTVYPLLNYFEISIILYIILTHSYKMFCEDLELSTNIEGIDICASIDEDISILINEYKKRSSENFKMYYKFHKK